MNLVKTQSAQKPGEYIRTLIDAKKEAADFLICDINGNHVTIRFKTDPNLNGRGITKSKNPGMYYVTRKALIKLQQQYNNYQVNF